MKKFYMIALGMIICLLCWLVVAGERVAAQSASEYEITLEALGYGDVEAQGPTSNVYYYFSAPGDWEILDGSYINLDLDYKIYALEDITHPLALLDVQFNDQHLHTEEWSAPITQRLRIDLPREQFRLAAEPQANVLRISFSESSDCESDLITSVIIKNTSVLHLVYRERALPVDLAFFPRPIYYRQWAFEPSQVRFVLPNEFDETDLRAAVIIAARLGQMTGNRTVISATLASEQPTDAFQGEHLIVVGSPDSNPVIGQLELPLPLTERRLMLRSQMPTAVSPGSVFSYTLFAENTTSRAESLIVEDRLSPAIAKFLECGESCGQTTAGRIRWDVGMLEAGQLVSKTVTLQVADVISFSTSLRHTATLFDSQENILNMDTLSTQIGEEPDNLPVASPSRKSASFFVQERQAVPEDAGVLQEMVSPWSARHVVVLVTGLDDEALLKAAHGLNPQNHFPGIWGESAIVEDVHPLSTTVSAPLQDTRFASLGYRDQELDVTNLEARDYVFDVPPGVTLEQDSYLALHLAHAAIVSTIGGGVKIVLNDVPIGSAFLDDSNLSDAWLKIPLSRTAVRLGSNRIRIIATASYIDRCLVKARNPYWLAIYDDSFLHLDYTSTRTHFDLSGFPYPFNWPGDLENLVFALPDKPSLTEVEGVLRIASLLGSGSESSEFMPQVAFGEGLDLISQSGINVIAVGLPTMNPIIRSVNGYLPQPFVSDSDDIYQSVDGPIYGILPGTNLGFVQVLGPHWDSGGKGVFVVATGTTEEGVTWALSALSQLSDRLRGDIAIVRGDQVYSTDTHPVTAEDVLSTTVFLTPGSKETSVTTAVETPTPQQALEQTPALSLSSQQAGAVETQPSQQISQQTGTRATPSLKDELPMPTSSSRPRWLLPLLAVSLFTVVVLIVLSVRKARL